MSQQLEQHVGDSVKHGIPLKWKGRRFEPGNDWTLIWTLRESLEQTSDILLQKETSLGLSHSGDDAIIELVPQETLGDAGEDPPIAAIAPGVYHWGVLATRISDGHRRTVATGTMELLDATITDSEVTTPIHTTTAPAPGDTITVGSVTTGAAGTDAAVENVGTFRNAIFNFTIPRGNVGAKGDKGDKGDQGDQGPAGATHDPATVTGNGITISGQQISLSIGTGSTQVAAGNDARMVAVTNATNNADADTLVKRDAGGGGVSFISGSGSGVAGQTYTGSGVRALSYGAGNGLRASSENGYGTYSTSSNGTAALSESGSGDYHHEFGGNGTQPNRSFVARVLGAFGWWRGAYTLMVSAVDTLTANRVQRFQDKSGTIALTSDIPDGDEYATAAQGAKADSAVQSNVTGVTGADAITNIMSLSQAEYDAITPAANTLYVIV